MGKCPDCDQWHTLVEEKQSKGSSANKKTAIFEEGRGPVPIDTVELSPEYRIGTQIDAL